MLPAAPFEEPLVELRQKIAELESFPRESARDREIDKLRGQLRRDTAEVFARLDRWQRALLARHPERPYVGEYVEHLMEDWVEVHGDRAFGDDPAIVAGFARFAGRSVAVIGHHKGRDTKERIHRNFGQPRPEGYRKALRVMRLAERFGRPVLTFIDTAGAHPGIGAEERGQAEAIARSTDCCLNLGVPIVSVIIGEGGSGGAVAIATANRIYMLEHSIYTVASPEAAASILWRDSARAVDAATNMKITAQDLLRLGIIDGIIPEPVGGAHRDGIEVVRATGETIVQALNAYEGLTPAEIRKERREKFLAMGRAS